MRYKLLVSLAAALLTSGAAFAQEPIRIGAFLAATGGAAFLGDPEQKTLELYVEKLNTAGGLLGRKSPPSGHYPAGERGRARRRATGD